jgi:hypothetical protein
MLRRGMLGLALLGVACDFPTEPPSWEQTWVVPGDSFTLGVSELLPPSVTLSDDGTAFQVVVPPTSTVTSLATVCGSPCQAADGMVAPKPAFTHTTAAAVSLPSQIVAARLAGGTFDLTIAHDLNFDPLRPAADPQAERGYLLVRVTSDGAEVARDSIDGDDRAFPPGEPIMPTLAVSPVDAGGQLDLEVTVYSPAGDPVEIDIADTVGVTLATSIVAISEVTITAGAIELPPVRAPFRVGPLEDPAVVDAVRRGALRLAVHNPFTVTGSLEVALDLDSRTLRRSLPIREGDYTERLEFSGPEVRELLTSPTVDMEASGVLTATGGTLTLAPTQKLVLQAVIELVIGVGSEAA